MRLKYVGGLSEATVTGADGSAKPGKTVEVADKHLAALAIETGDWVKVDDGPGPEKKAPVKPTPQKGG
jgi:hypothetical protein